MRIVKFHWFVTKLNKFINAFSWFITKAIKVPLAKFYIKVNPIFYSLVRTVWHLQLIYNFIIYFWKNPTSSQNPCTQHSFLLYLDNHKANEYPILKTWAFIYFGIKQWTEKINFCKRFKKNCIKFSRIFYVYRTENMVA